jgi:hypothetical protein
VRRDDSPDPARSPAKVADLGRALRLAAGQFQDVERHMAKAQFLVTIESLRPITPEEFAERLRAMGDVVDCKVETVQ